MSFLGDLGGDQPGKRHSEEILRKISFVQIKDGECGVVGWVYLVESESIQLRSNRTFDTLEEAIEDYLEGRKRKNRNDDRE